VRRWPWWAIAFLVVQVAVPLWQLTAPRPARFGWQMYAGLSQPAVFTAVKPDGSMTTVPLDEYIIRPRDDLDLIRYLPPAICARTGAIAVRYRAVPDHEPHEVPCPR
jgi:hypothetical protein